MTQQAKSLLTDQMKRAVGVEWEPTVLDVERGHVRRFAEAIGDSNPLFIDEKRARKSCHGGLIAPPTFLRAVLAPQPKVDLKLPQRVLDGGSDWEYFGPVRVGDVITARAKIASIAERTLSLGPALFVTTEISYVNQFGEVVATQRSTRICY
ncbi:MAG: MaoC family dehydratase N-terminal domain-containing protein [Chloroflexi bacterium]|nr:MaoC family dehydratase N-terminal domain-containing protein [Chloroflexota bacterium]